MYLLYLDESGDPFSWDEWSTFVLAGVAVFEGEVNKVVQQMNAIQNQFFPEIPVPLNLHASHIHNGKGRFRLMSPESRDKLMRAVYSVIVGAKWPGIVPFATAIDISWAGPGKEACAEAMSEICRMLNLFLERQYKRGNRGKGLLILDPSGREARYRQCIAGYRAHGASWGYLGNVVDVPLFVASNETRMMQLADFCAYAVFLHYERHIDDFFNMISPQFPRLADGTVYGLSYVTGSRAK